MSSKHGGNMAGGHGIADAIRGTMQKVVDEAAKDSVPMVGASFQPGASGELQLVIVGKHPLGLKGVAIHVDAVNALMLAGSIADGVAQSMLKGMEAMAKATSKPAKVD